MNGNLDMPRAIPIEAQVRAKLLNCTKNRILVTCTLSNINIFTQPAQCVLLFLVLVGNSALF